MKKLFFLTAVLMGVYSIDAFEGQVTAMTRSMIDQAKRSQYDIVNSMPKNIRLPLIIGNKQLHLNDLEKLSPQQRNLLYEVSHPSCCLMPYGVSNTVLREEDIKRLQEVVPSLFTESFEVFVVKERSECLPLVDCLLPSTVMVSLPSGVPGASLVIGGLCNDGCIMSNMLATGLGLGTFSVSYAMIAALATVVYPCVCRDREWRTFNDQDISGVTQKLPDSGKSISLESSSSESDS